MATAVPIVLLAVGGLAALALVVLVLRMMPRAAFVVWACVLFFVPLWVGVNIGFYWAAITLLTALLIVVNWSIVPLRAADAWVAVFIIVTVGLYAFGSVDLASLVAALLEWVIPYIWGRVVLARVGTAWVTSTIAIVAVVAATLAVVEFFTSFNPFVLIPGSGVIYDTWSPLQERGGVLRAEGAFGHSIALGAALAMSSAFVVATRWRLAPKISGVVIIAVATVLTFSRVGLLTLVLTLILSTFLIAGVSTRFRATVAVAGAVGTAIVIPIIDTVFGAAGEEAGGSADYRTDLLVLLEQVQVFGNPGDWHSLVSGDYYLGYFARSVDNALVLTLLRYGYVPTFLIMAAVVCAAWMALRRSTRSPAALAVVGQLPSLVVVALITQYSMFLWFCVGLAITWARDSAMLGGADDEAAGVDIGPPEGLRLPQGARASHPQG
ncbi:hypothetical protein HCX50_02990 [Microbacterium oxydans]|uniref:hypothetical protein n=1 Tax=Microbacterium sp. B19(2022) TaxID=2914045 RepID=UPI00142F6E66|nr:hypothetical protein [Microbacterium sp. B19(2022)]NJI58392.1 hypothetical protein [Microbacterium sp. B19(2022)]